MVLAFKRGMGLYHMKFGSIIPALLIAGLLAVWIYGPYSSVLKECPKIQSAIPDQLMGQPDKKRWVFFCYYFFFYKKGEYWYSTQPAKISGLVGQET